LCVENIADDTVRCLVMLSLKLSLLKTSNQLRSTKLITDEEIYMFLVLREHHRDISGPHLW